VNGMPASPRTGLLGAARAVPISSHRSASGTSAVTFHHILQGKDGSIAAASGRTGVLSGARSGVAGLPSTAGPAAARQVTSRVVSTARPVLPVTALPAPGVPVPAVALPVVTPPVVALPAPVTPAADAPVTAVPALPVVPLRPAAPAERTALQPPWTAASGATGIATHRSHSAVSSPTPVRIGPRPSNHTAAALPQQPGTPPAGRHPGLVPALSLGSGSGNNPLDGGLLATHLPRLDGTAAGGKPSRAGMPPRQRASAPSTSPD
jgi:hypothetical protein